MKAFATKSMLFLGMAVGLLFICQGATHAVAQDNGDGCSDVLFFSGRNYTKDTLDFSVAERVYDQYCQGNAAKSGMSFDSGMEAVIKAVPFSGHLSGGTTTEQVTNFCKTFNSDYRRDESRYHQTSLVERSATNAWLACKELTAKGVLFRPRLQRTAFTIEVARRSADPITIEGIIYDPKLLTCSVPSSKISPKHRVTADQNTQKELTSDYWPVSCTRIATMQNNVATYPEADIQVSTTRGTFPLTVPKDELLPLQWASEIADRQNDLDSAIKLLQAALPTIGTDDNQGQKAFARGHGNQNIVCPPGQFVSAIAATEWNSDHNDALVANIGVQCRKALTADTK
jgi:hypothetical protein